MCINAVGLRQDIPGRAILDAIREVLSPDVLSRAVEKAPARLTASKSRRADHAAMSSAS